MGYVWLLVFCCWFCLWGADCLVLDWFITLVLAVGVGVYLLILMLLLLSFHLLCHIAVCLLWVSAGCGWLVTATVWGFLCLLCFGCLVLAVWGCCLLVYLLFVLQVTVY